ncbi:Virus attachment protein p12 family, partial [Dysosmobacter welbionis]
TVLDTVGFDALLPGATAVLTGEGRIDCQSLRGKVVIGIAHRARQTRIPV